MRGKKQKKCLLLYEFLTAIMDMAPTSFTDVKEISIWCSNLKTNFRVFGENKTGIHFSTSRLLTFIVNGSPLKTSYKNVNEQKFIPQEE